MKRFVDYNPTLEEIDYVFGSEESYRIDREEIWPKNSLDDDEKASIAQLLDYRGKEEEADKMFESIEDEEFRERCMQMRDHIISDENYITIVDGVP